MKRFLWAAFLAVFMHALFFGLGGHFFDEEIHKPRLQTLSFTLATNTVKSHTQQSAKSVAKTDVPKPPRTEKPPVLPVVPTIPDPEKVPPEKEKVKEPEEVLEEDVLPKTALPEVEEKVVPEVKKPVEEKSEKTSKPVVEKRPAPIPQKKVQQKKKKTTVKRKPPEKRKNVQNKSVKKTSAPLQPVRKAVESPEAPVVNQQLGSASPSNAQTNIASVTKTGATTDTSSVVKAYPVYASNPRPKYPRVARRRGYEGVLLLKVLVNGDGKVADLLVLKS
ncbi:MAG: energy transducer TonB, partial [Deltaproteobacteria bacterium]|nr:energy transducer TonB [Deltaproteobacteria bacterium]